MSYEDKILRCRDCGVEFLFSASEQEFYASKGFQHEPRRCPSCRSARRQSMGQFGGEAAVGLPAASSPTNDGAATAGESSSGRQMYVAICAACGGEALIPFVPRTQKPVYCQSCFEKQRLARTR